MRASSAPRIGIALACLVAATTPLFARDFQVGVLYWSMNIAGQVAMRRGLEAEAERLNLEAAKKGEPGVALIARVAGDGEAGIELQIRQMMEFIARRVDLIIVQPTDNAALDEALREANKAGIPVVAYDQYISGGNLAAYRSSDNYEAGQLDGEYLSSLFPPGRQLRLVMVEYPHVSSTVERVDGFLDALSALHRDYRILKSYEAVEPSSGAAAAAAMLADFPEPGSIDAVFTVNDGGGLAVVAGLAAAGRREIKVATVDGDPQSVANIAEGRLTVIDAAQFCGPLGAEAMRAAYTILKGEKVPLYALVPVFPVTAETLSRYPGWAGPIPSPFRKPWQSDDPLWEGGLRVIKQ
ncbi:MAG TPA: substrate-binding domain-containing protein [Rectinemataceae bacterium]|nr:substrate-binding domain-containing protein [Rectinemataceae bacterium]